MICSSNQLSKAGNQESNAEEEQGRVSKTGIIKNIQSEKQAAAARWTDFITTRTKDTNRGGELSSWWRIASAYPAACYYCLMYRGIKER